MIALRGRCGRLNADLFPREVGLRANRIEHGGSLWHPRLDYRHGVVLVGGVGGVGGVVDGDAVRAVANMDSGGDTLAVEMDHRHSTFGFVRDGGGMGTATCAVFATILFCIAIRCWPICR